LNIEERFVQEKVASVIASEPFCGERGNLLIEELPTVRRLLTALHPHRGARVVGLSPSSQ
jgi:hypothetical protein